LQRDAPDEYFCPLHFVNFPDKRFMYERFNCDARVGKMPPNSHNKVATMYEGQGKNGQVIARNKAK